MVVRVRTKWTLKGKKKSISLSRSLSLFKLTSHCASSSGSSKSFASSVSALTPVLMSFSVTSGLS